jgi:serine/threonine protein kinase
MIGTTIGHYQILEKLGEGGMGIVYKALDTKLNRFVALKFLPAHLTQDESTRKRFITEAQAASALDHPNICTIYEINETTDGQLFICMAYYAGESLRQKLKRGPIPFNQGIFIVAQIALGLKAAHENGIIHRDIKPGNILITEKDYIKIVDFGLAKLAGMEMTKSTSSKGTAAYMCPEQIRGQKVDHRCDIWALGVVFYEALTGHLPFEGEFPEPMMYAIVNHEPLPLSKYLDDVPNKLQDIICKLLEKDPSDRYADTLEIVDDLQSQMDWDASKLIYSKPSFNKTISASIPQPREGIKVAVLPVESLARVTDEQDWFNEAMTDEVITKLAQISGLRVTSRSSSIQYKKSDKSTPQIASELDVQYLVEASSLKIDGQVKIKAKLIDAIKDEYIWVEEYEGALRNIIELQGQIAKEVAKQVRIELTPQEESRLSKKREVNPETYEMYMKGMYHLNKFTPDGIGKGLSYLQQAVDNNPDEPLTHAALAIAYCLVLHGASPIPDALSRAKTAALKAVELDDTLADVHLALTMVKTFDEMDWRNATISIKRTLEINPNLALARYWYGYLLRIPGHFEEGYAEMTRAKQLDPLNPVYPADLGMMYYLDGRFDEAIDECHKSIEINPQFPQAHQIIGYAYAAKGMYEQALEVQRKIGEFGLDWKSGLGYTYALTGQDKNALEVIAELEAQPFIWYMWGIAEIYAALGENDKAIEWLEKAYDQHHPFIQWIRRYRHFKSLDNDPRFINLANKLNLPE